MRAKTGTAVLMLGVGIGLASAWTLSRVVSSEAPLERGPQPRESQPDPALARERAARIEAEAARDALAEELTRSRTTPRPSPDAALTTAATPTTAIVATETVPSREPLAAKTKPDPARLATLDGLVREALAHRDQRSAVALLREIAPLGRSGWPLAVQLIPLLGHSNVEGSGLEKSDLSPAELARLAANPYELRKVLTSDDLTPLYADAIANGAHYTAEMRQTAAAWLPSADPFVARELFRSALLTEQDEVVATAMIEGFFADSEPESIATLVAAVRSQPSAAIRLTLTQVLSNDDGTEAMHALEGLAHGDPDEKVRQAARVALVTRNPPVAGVLVTQVVEDSNAAHAGVLEGDIIVSYRGIPTLTLGALQEAKKTAPKNDVVLLEVWRDGQVQRLQLPAGQLGVNGHGVQPGNAPVPEGDDDR